MGAAAFHVRTGERSADHAISVWLDHHGYVVMRCADAFEATARLLTRPDIVPEIAFIGTTWLEVDDFALFGYVRSTWPSVGIVAFGDERAAIVSRNLPRVIVCPTPEELARLLNDDPLRLQGRFATVRIFDSPTDHPEPDTPAAELQPIATDRLNGDPPTSVQSHGIPDVPRPDESGILTREELAALLDDIDD